MGVLDGWWVGGCCVDVGFVVVVCEFGDGLYGGV